jgi:hypothetical protein
MNEYKIHYYKIPSYIIPEVVSLFEIIRTDTLPLPLTTITRKYTEAVQLPIHLL